MICPSRTGNMRLSQSYFILDLDFFSGREQRVVILGGLLEFRTVISKVSKVPQVSVVALALL